MAQALDRGFVLQKSLELVSMDTGTFGDRYYYPFKLCWVWGGGGAGLCVCGVWGSLLSLSWDFSFPCSLYLKVSRFTKLLQFVKIINGDQRPIDCLLGRKNSERTYVP
jgi:hypothetical protein